MLVWMPQPCGLLERVGRLGQTFSVRALKDLRTISIDLGVCDPDILDLLAIQMSIDFRDMIAAARDHTPLLLGQALRMIAITVVCSSVKTLDNVLNEVWMKALSEV